MRLFEYLWVAEQVRPGSTRMTLMTLMTVLAGLGGLMVVWAALGPNALGTAITCLLYAALVGVIALPVLALAWGVFLVVMWLSLGGATVRSWTRKRELNARRASPGSATQRG